MNNNLPVKQISEISSVLLKTTGCFPLWYGAFQFGLDICTGAQKQKV
jgi:hypothetical protein